MKCTFRTRAVGLAVEASNPEDSEDGPGAVEPQRFVRQLTSKPWLLALQHGLPVVETSGTIGELGRLGGEYTSPVREAH
jgi:hypothetical protein